jgi:hypothetical protein
VGIVRGFACNSGEDGGWKNGKKIIKGKPFVLYDGVLDLFNAHWNI